MSRNFGKETHPTDCRVPACVGIDGGICRSECLTHRTGGVHFLLGIGELQRFDGPAPLAFLLEVQVIDYLGQPEPQQSVVVIQFKYQ